MRRDQIVPQPLSLPRALAQLNPDLSRAQIQRLVVDGQVFVEGKRCQDIDRPVDAGTRIVLHVVESGQAQSLQAPAIVYQDEDIIVVDKRAGQHVNETETSAEWAMVEQLRAHNAYTVHRLDRETSGVVVFARGRVQAQALSRAFQERRVHKTYWAVVAGQVPVGVIDKPIAPDPRRPRARCVRSSGQAAVTRVLSGVAMGDRLSAVVLSPETGRTHQLRVHLAYMGAPIVGDALYGGPLKVRMGDNEVAAQRVWLHAHRITFPLHDRLRTFEAPLPQDMPIASSYFASSYIVSVD